MNSRHHVVFAFPLAARLEARAGGVSARGGRPGSFRITEIDRLPGLPETPAVPVKKIRQCA